MHKIDPNKTIKIKIILYLKSYFIFINLFEAQNTS